MANIYIRGPACKIARGQDPLHWQDPRPALREPWDARPTLRKPWALPLPREPCQPHVSSTSPTQAPPAPCEPHLAARAMSPDPLEVLHAPRGEQLFGCLVILPLQH